MVTCKKLVEGTCKKLGNHRKVVKDYGQVEQYIYHSTVIVEVNHARKTIELNNGGWTTSSTTRAINSYLRELGYLNYDIIDNR